MSCTIVRALPRLVTAALLLHATVGNALSLGDLSLFSSMGEPLDARIALHLAADEQIGLVEVAPLAEGESTGQPPSQEGLQMRVEAGVDAAAHIRVTTSAPLTRPDFVFWIRSAYKDRLAIRKYSLHLITPSKTSNSSATALSAPLPIAPASTPEMANENSYRVKLGESISQLGFMLRPDKGVTGAQMSIALYRHNPDAFLNRDINRILVGERLEIPSRQQALAISYERAIGVISGGDDARELLALQEPTPSPQPASPSVPPTSQPYSPSLTLLTNNAEEEPRQRVNQTTRPTPSKIKQSDENQILLANTIMELQFELSEQYAISKDVTRLVETSITVMNTLRQSVREQAQRIESLEQTVQQLQGPRLPVNERGHNVEPSITPAPAQPIYVAPPLTTTPTPRYKESEMQLSDYLYMILGFMLLAIIVTLLINKKIRERDANSSEEDHFDELVKTDLDELLHQQSKPLAPPAHHREGSSALAHADRVLHRSRR